eukprot:2454536-Pleurochrysis_carterae.AAC.1
MPCRVGSSVPAPGTATATEKRQMRTRRSQEASAAVVSIRNGQGLLALRFRKWRNLVALQNP